MTAPSRKKSIEITSFPETAEVNSDSVIKNNSKEIDYTDVYSA